MQLPETHYGDVVSFVKKRMEERQEGLSDYITNLFGNREEYIRFVEAITINESYFFRDGRHFTIICNEILPRLFSRQPQVKIWSAASAAGEEAISIAALCNALIKKYPGKEYSIYASDINASALEKMREGRYTKAALRKDGSEFHSYLLPYISEKKTILTVDEAIRERIVILEHNLFKDDYSALPDDFDLVMLRNVFIYMPMENRHSILHQVAPKIKTNGCLFLSASEVPLIWHPTLKIDELSGTYFFRRTVPETDRSEPTLKRRREAPGTVKAAPARTDRFNTGELYETVNHLLYNPLFEKSERRVDELAGLLVSLVTSVNSGDIMKGGDILDTLEDELGTNEVVLHYRGILEKLGGKPEQSRTFFQKALELQQEFWPARYELSMQLKESARDDAKRHFTICKRDILRYIENGEYSYHFLLDGFNALYFLRICTFWEQKLGGSVNGSR